MMNKKIVKLLCIALVVASLANILGGCGTAKSEIPAKPVLQESVKESLEDIKDSIEGVAEELRDNIEDATEKLNLESDVVDFNTSLKQYIEEKDNVGDSYIASPMSLKYAMGLLAAAAEGETRQKLLDIVGFETIDEYYEWAANIDKFVAEFKELVDTEEEDAVPQGPDENGEVPVLIEERWGYSPATGAFDIANSIWHNDDMPIGIKEEFVAEMKEKFGAELQNVPFDKLSTAINDWVNEKTKGLIPQLVGDLDPLTDTVLVNALYFKSAWMDTFRKDEERDFTTKNGEVIKKQFMTNQKHYKFYQDDDTKLISIPMEGGVSLVLVEGSQNDVLTRYNEAQYTDIILHMPKWETESTINCLFNYLVDNGMIPAGDFSNMTDADVRVSDVIQKAVIKLDEDGLEAAAATAIVMITNAAFELEPPKPLEIFYDNAFNYYLIANTENGPEVMFFGQLGD